MTIFLTILSGVIVFVLGQVLLKLFIEPWQKQKDVIAKISFNLVFLANKITNPGLGSQEELKEVSVKLRNLASELVESCNRIPFYRKLSYLKIFIHVDNIIEARKNLIGLSNSLYKEGNAIDNSNKSEAIKRLLKIDID